MVSWLLRVDKVTSSGEYAERNPPMQAHQVRLPWS